MSKKVKDEKNRWRNKVIAFRASPEEAAEIDKRWRRCGFTSKQDYLIECVTHPYVIARGNPQMLFSLRHELAEIKEELMRINEASEIDENLIDALTSMLGISIILSMSKMFLLNKMSNFSMDVNESFCFLFPTELLFEGFIGGFMQDVVGEHGGKVRLQQSDMKLIENVIYGGKSLGSAFTMRHDILVEVNNKVFILDTKYKQISRFERNPEEIMRIVNEEPKQTDIYQVCEYARKRDIADVYLLYPLYRYEDNEPDFPIGVSSSPSGDINIHFVRLPFIFEDDEAKTEDMLREVIEQVLKLK